MKYRIEVETDGKRYPLLNQILRLDGPTLRETAGNSPGYLKFKISPTHPHYSEIQPLRSELFAYEDGVEIFRGRSTTTEEAFNRTNQLTCESDLAYLCDSIVRPYEHQGSIYDFVKKMLDNHNSQVESRKRYQIGVVNVTDSNNYIHRSNTVHSNTLDCLREKLVKTHGGYLRTRLGADGVRYLDYVTDGGGTNDQVIRYGVNLAGYNKSQDATTLFTALIPTGADLEVSNADGTLTTKAVDITSVNGGADYIYDSDAVSRYGWIFRQQKWEDVTLPENLLIKAKAYLAQSLYLSDVLKLTAVDLAGMDVNVGRLKTGYWTRVVSKPHEIDVLYILEERTRYLQEPGKDTVSLGGTIATLSGSTAKANAEMTAYVQQIASSTNKEINRAVSNATQLITGGLGGYVVIGRSSNGQPEEFLIMDAPVKENAQNVIRLNRNGLGFSTSGYNGTYRNAWTIDGRLVADFIVAGTMLADRIRGGTLALGGLSNQNGVLRILDASGTQIGIWDKDGIQLSAGTAIVKLTPGGKKGALVLNGDSRWSSGQVTKAILSIDYDRLQFYDDIDAPNTYNSSLTFDGLYVQGEAREDVANYGVDCAAINGFFDGDLSVYGAKDRVVRTAQFGEIRMSAYETSSPMFGDIGSGQVGDDGQCYISLDPVFLQTVNTGCEYQVFLQAYGAGELIVSDREPTFFIVRGTPGLNFSWEVKAKQAGYEQNRMDTRIDVKRESTGYAAAGQEYYMEYMKGLIS